MSQVDDFEGTEEEGSDNQSAVFNAIRKENRELAKKVASFEAAQAEAETAALTQRAEAVKGIVDTLGLPGLANDVLGWIEGPITVEAVAEALKVRGIPLPEGVDVQPEPEKDSVVNVSDVAQRVADAAGGKSNLSVEERINAAETQDELNAILAEASLTSSHS